MRKILRRLSSLRSLLRPLSLTFIGVVLLSLGCAYFFVYIYREIDGLPQFFYALTLQFLPRLWRGVLLFVLGLGVIAVGLWQLSGVVVISLQNLGAAPSNEMVVGFRDAGRPPKIVVLSGGAGMLVLSPLSEYVARMTCIVPVQDPVEYYYRAAGLFSNPDIYYLVPTPTPVQVWAQLDDGTRRNLKQVDLEESLAERHIDHLELASDETPPAALEVPRLALEALRDADVILLGPGSVHESIVPNLLIPGFREAVRDSKALKLYIGNLMTEPGLTTGFSLGDHIREIRRYGGFTPDYTLVNAQRIEPEIYQLYAAAHQSPVYLAPEEYDETSVIGVENLAERRIIVEGSVVIEADLSTSVIQYSALLDRPGESKAVRVLRHDSQKLTAAIRELIRRKR